MNKYTFKLGSTTGAKKEGFQVESVFFHTALMRLGRTIQTNYKEELRPGMTITLVDIKRIAQKQNAAIAEEDYNETNEEASTPAGRSEAEASRENPLHT